MKIPSSANKNPCTLANRIRLARQHAGLSQAELAEHSGVTPSAVAQWENPHGTRPDLDHLIRIGAATKLTLDWLVTGNGGQALPKKTRGPQDSPAIILDTFAQSLLEENILACLRHMRPHARELLVAIAQEMAKDRGGSQLQRR